MKAKLGKLYSYILKLNLQDGISKTNIPYINIQKISSGKLDFPVLSESFIYYIVSGSMCVYNDDGFKEFSEGDFIVSQSYRPLLCTVQKNNIFLAIIVHFSVEDIVSVLIDIEDEILKINSSIDDILLGKYSEKFLEILIRIFDSCGNRFMMNHIKKEFVYEIIVSSYGKTFIENSLNIQLSSKIFNINSWIRQNYKNEFSVEDLAIQANMSISNFHQKFKASVGMGPIQCQKKLRLVEARRLMLDDSVNVTSAALEVGYESVSQFVSDYRRMFGCSPQKDIQEIRKRLIISGNVRDIPDNEALN